MASISGASGNMPGTWCVEHDMKWAQKMIDLLKTIKDEIASDGDLDVKRINLFMKRYRRVLRQGQLEMSGLDAELTKKAVNLGKRLEKYSDATLRFMKDSSLPFTNNLAERDIRMTKVKQKVSGCFRSLNGAKCYARIRSYILTCEKHGMSAQEAMERLFGGDPPEFLLN